LEVRLSYGLGVDLGTSFTGAAVSHAGQTRMVTLGDQTVLMPSVVRVQPDGTLLTGDSGSRSTTGEDPGRTGRNFKRRLGDPTPLVLGGQPHSAVSLLAATLDSVMQAATKLEGTPLPDRIVLTYPAVWGPYRREQFDEVPRRAGLNEVALVSEPEAAATHYAARRQLGEGDLVAVYDLGGGTFDTTVTRVTAGGVEILGVPEGVEWIGGVDFDEAVLAHVDRSLGGALSALDPRDPASALILQRVRQACVQAKEALSRDTSTSMVLSLPGQDAEVRLTRDEFESMIRTPLESTLEALHRTLNSAGVRPGQLAGVLLVGGSSRIPLVSQMLSADLGRPVLVDPQPQHCVALGAASIAEGMATQASGAPPGRRLGRLGSRFGGHRPGQGRRRLLAATAAGALLIGGAAYAGQGPEPTATPSPPEQSPAAAQPLLPTGTPPPATLIGSPIASTSPSPTASASAKASAKPKPSAAAVSPTPAFVATVSVVLGMAGKCLDVANALAVDGREIELYTCNGSPAQSWTLAADRTFRALGKCMDASTARIPADPENPQVQLRTCKGGSTQTWHAVNGTIVNPATKLCLGVIGNNPVDRATLFLGSCRNDGGQLWTIPGL
jgi:actin-like ATPase involved in cell morphogenesis